MNEIQALLRLRGHPNIVQLYEVFEDREHIYMAMEYCSGGNLHNYLVAYGKLTESHARQWFRQLLSAVMFCQQQGVVSRDIKNSNVVIDDEGNAKLADFGLCVLVNNVNIERIGSSAGSAVFAAPEVYSARKTPYQVIPSEMWALGAVLHSMIKRVLPFPHENYSQHWHAYHVPENVSQSLQHLLKGLLAFNPQDRLSPIGVLSHPWVSGRPTMAPSSAEPAVRAARRHSHTAYTSAFQTNTLAV
jgi:serine/threonine protein kinase